VIVSACVVGQAQGPRAGTRGHVAEPLRTCRVGEDASMAAATRRAPGLLPMMRA